MTESEKVLISIIGNPSNYRDAKYHYKDHEKVSKFSSLAILDAEKPDKKVLIGQYTLATKGQSFDDIVNDSKNMITTNIPEAKDFDIIISPGVFYAIDRTNKVFSFKGEIYNFYAYTLYKLAKVLEGIDKDLEVILDLTHGINYT